MRRSERERERKPGVVRPVTAPGLTACLLLLVIVTLGGGTPRRLLSCPLDEETW